MYFFPAAATLSTAAADTANRNRERCNVSLGRSCAAAEGVHCPSACKPRITDIHCTHARPSPRRPTSPTARCRDSMIRTTALFTSLDEPTRPEPSRIPHSSGAIRRPCKPTTETSKTQTIHTHSLGRRPPSCHAVPARYQMLCFPAAPSSARSLASPIT
ncbi:hypothetical protein EDC01DRAFT_205692 [Geopyxis carbonaria]|nr:hypothetical protein EDC01DRAFT_205692 [Geopyxis carbonaria]